MIRTLRNERGIALFLVLWILMLLSVIVGEFCHAMRTEVNITRNFKEEAQSYYIARAGVTIGINELLRHLARPAAVVSVKGREEDAPEDPWRINQAMPDFAYGGGFFRVRLEDEGGKVNINRAGPGLLRAMLDGFDLSDAERDVIVDSILDWRDADDFHRMNGAESEYYEALPDPYRAKNGDFSSPEELMRVRGVTAEIFYGGLEEMITVHPGNPRLPLAAAAGASRGGSHAVPFSYDRINVNAAPVLLLASLPGMTRELAEAVITAREIEPFRSYGDLVSVLGSEAYGAVSPYLAIQRSPVYAVTAVGYPSAESDSTGGGLRRGVRAVVEIGPRPDRKYRILQWLDNVGTF